MTTIDEYTVVVSSDIELRDIIIGENNVNYIYFDQDITLTSGIRIPISKANLIIDGTYKEIRHRYTDMSSTTATNSIHINSLNSTIPTMNITMKNMDITGRNYYGIIFVYDSRYAANVTTTYENVNYVGCQITYNNYGKTQYIDSTITINNTTSILQGEIGEVHKVVIGGNTTISHTFTGYNGFIFRGGSGASFEILPDANVTINVGRNLFEGSLSSMTFGANSICNITVPNGLSYDISQRVNDVLIDLGATLNVYRTNTSGSATLYINNTFTISDGANVLMKSTVSSSNPHLYFYNGNASLKIDNPACCIFYNSGSSNFYFTETSNISLKSYQINQWNTAPTIGNIYNLPTYQWIKSDREQIEFTGTATNTATNISYNNLDPEKDADLPNVTALQLRTLRVLSLGYLPLLNVNRCINTVPKVSGISIADAGLKTQHNESIIYGVADTGGNFDIAITDECLVGDEISVMNSDNNFLFNLTSVMVEEEGELTLYAVPETLPFDVDNPVSRTPLLFGRIPAGWTIQVYDSRVISSDWTLSASVYEDLTSENNHVLPDALVYVDDDSTTILSETPTLVFQGEDNGGETKITNVNWNVDKGILLKIDTSPIYLRETYTTDITWTLDE